jgi:L-aminopeptidase/D-esterase-like protein
MIDFIIFGIVDNAIMILGAMTGLSIEKYLPKVIGAGIGNAVSDFMGGATTASWELAFGTAFGCIIGLVFIPLFKKIQDMYIERK